MTEEKPLVPVQARALASVADMVIHSRASVGMADSAAPGHSADGMLPKGLAVEVAPDVQPLGIQSEQSALELPVDPLQQREHHHQKDLMDIPVGKAVLASRGPERSIHWDP